MPKPVPELRAARARFNDTQFLSKFEIYTEPEQILKFQSLSPFQRCTTAEPISAEPGAGGHFKDKKIPKKISKLCRVQTNSKLTTCPIPFQRYSAVEQISNLRSYRPHVTIRQLTSKFQCYAITRASNSLPID